LNIPTKIFLKKCFKEYYRKHKITGPKEINHREFGIGMLENKISIRHKEFNTIQDFNRYLKNEGPYYISYSTSYYRYPSGFPMLEKSWFGSDLVFDIDIPMDVLNSVGLNQAKEETFKLIYLLNDLGIGNNDIKINYSGNRGYHVHVCNENLNQLGKDERREILNYVTGEGLNLKYDSNWSRRIKTCLVTFFNGAQVEDYKNIGFTKFQAESLMKKSSYISKRISKGCFNVHGVKDSIQKVIKNICLRSFSNPDKSVTTDLSRLIRVPDTLHGSTGLVTMSLSNLEAFNPLVDAIGIDSSYVMVDVNASFELNGECFNLHSVNSIQKYIAVYCLLNGFGEIIENG